MAWYSVNKLTVTQGSAVVTGTGTQFSTFVRPGFGIFIDKVPYEVSAADSPTRLTLKEAYAGPSRQDVSYSIWPTTAVDVQVWTATTELIETFGPLRNNLALLTSQISDTAEFKTSAAASAIAAATSEANALASKNAASSSATGASNSATAAAGSASSANTYRANAASSASAAAGSASDANAAKLAAEASASAAQSNKDETDTLKSVAQTAKDGAVSAQSSSEAARDTAIAAKGASESARDQALGFRNAAQSAQTGSETARDQAAAFANAAAGSATAAGTSETNSASNAASASTAKSGAENARDAAAGSATAAAASATTAEVHKSSAASSATQAQNHAEAAALSAQQAAEPVNAQAIADALGGTPALLREANFTGPISVPSDFTVRAQNADNEGGQIVLKKAPNQTIDGDMVIDTQGGNFRVYDNVTTGRMLAWNAVAGTLSMNGQTVYNTANLDISKYVRNDTGQDITGILTIRGGGLACGIRAINATAGRDYRMLSRDDGSFSISDESAGAVRFSVGSNGVLYAGSANVNAIWHAGNFNPGNYAALSGATFTGAVTAGTASGNFVQMTGDGAIEILNSTGNPYIDFKKLNTTDYDVRIQADTTNKKLNISSALDVGGLTYMKTAYHTGQNQLVLKYETGTNPSLIQRNDGSNFYFLISGASAAPSENFNGLRPLTINLSSGQFQSTNGQYFAGGMSVDGTATFNSPIEGRAYPRRSNDGGPLNFSWSGQGGQPTWLWGGSDGTNMFVYNPSNFSVNYASSAGTSSQLNGMGGGNQGSYIRRSNDATANGAWSRQLVLSGSDNSYDIWSPPLEIREVGLVGNADTSSARSPGIVFHHASTAAAAIKMNPDASFRFIAQGSTGSSYRPIYTSDVYTQNWFRPLGTGGVHWDSYGRGITVADAGSSYGNINVYGSGAGGWQGYSINNWMTMMSNGAGTNSARGFYSAENGGWLLQWDSANNAVFPGNITAFSDERLKRNLRPIDNAAERRAGMAKAAILYEREGVSRVGFGAQTLEPYVPEVVITADDLVGTKSVNYSDTIAILAVDADERANELAGLRAEVAALRTLIMELKGK